MKINMKKKYLMVFAFFATCLMLILPANFAVQGDSREGPSPSTNLFALANLSVEEIFAEFLNELGINNSVLTPEELARLYREEIVDITPEESNAFYENEYGVNLSSLSNEDIAREAQARISEGEQFITEYRENITNSFHQTGINLSQQTSTVMGCVIIGLLTPFGGPFYNLTCFALRTAAAYFYALAIILFLEEDYEGAALAFLFARMLTAFADSLNCPPLFPESLPVNVEQYNINVYNAGIPGCPFCE